MATTTKPRRAAPVLHWDDDDDDGPYGGTTSTYYSQDEYPDPDFPDVPVVAPPAPESEPKSEPAPYQPSLLLAKYGKDSAFGEAFAFLAQAKQRKQSSAAGGGTTSAPQPLAPLSGGTTTSETQKTGGTTTRATTRASEVSGGGRRERETKAKAGTTHLKLRDTPNEVMDALRAEAAKQGISVPACAKAILAAHFRIVLHQGIE